jgi:type VI secretion system protein VasG
MRKIIRLKLGRIAQRVRANGDIALTYGDELVDAVAARCTEVDSGARNVDHILTDTLLPELSRRILEKMAAEEQIRTIHVAAGGEGFEFQFNQPAPASGAAKQNLQPMEVN